MGIPSSPTPIVPPTASPTFPLTPSHTFSPTASPTEPLTASPTNPIIESPTNAPIDCSDGDLFSAQAGTRVFTKSCDWLLVGQRSNYCNTWMSWHEGNEVKNCQWLDRQSKKGDICADVETDGVYPSAREACPTSCGVGSC